MGSEQLELKRQELKERLSAIYRDYGYGLPADSEEQARVLQNAEVLAEIERVTRAELERVEKLLATGE